MALIFEKVPTKSPLVLTQSGNKLIKAPDFSIRSPTNNSAIPATRDPMKPLPIEPPRARRSLIVALSPRWHALLDDFLSRDDHSHDAPQPFCGWLSDALLPGAQLRSSNVADAAVARYPSSLGDTQRIARTDRLFSVSSSRVMSAIQEVPSLSVPDTAG